MGPNFESSSGSFGFDGLPANVAVWQLAQERRSLNQASSHVQGMLEGVFRSMVTTSLEVERRHAQVKRRETTKLAHMATVSRDALLRRYAMQRDQDSKVILDAAAAQRSARKLRTTSLLWWQPAEARPIGQPFTVGQQQAPAAVRQQRAPAAKRRRTSGSHQGARGSHQGTSADEIDVLRTEVAERMAAANQAMQDVDDARAGFPVTHFQWKACHFCIC